MKRLLNTIKHTDTQGLPQPLGIARQNGDKDSKGAHSRHLEARRGTATRRSPGQSEEDRDAAGLEEWSPLIGTKLPIMPCPPARGGSGATSPATGTRRGKGEDVATAAMATGRHGNGAAVTVARESGGGSDGGKAQGAITPWKGATAATATGRGKAQGAITPWNGATAATATGRRGNAEGAATAGAATGRHGKGLAVATAATAKGRHGNGATVATTVAAVAAVAATATGRGNGEADGAAAVTAVTAVTEERAVKVEPARDSGRREHERLTRVMRF